MVAITLISGAFLLLNAISFGSFLLETTTSKSLSVTAIILEDRPVIEVLEGGDAADDGFAVVLNLADARVALEVENGQFGHVDENLLEDVWILNLVVLQVKCGDRGALKKAAHIIETTPSDSIACKVDHVELVASGEALDLADHIVAQVKVGQVDEVVQALNFSDAVLMDVQTT